MSSSADFFLTALQVIMVAGVNLKQYRSSDEQYNAVKYLISQLRTDTRFRSVPIVMMVESVACQTASEVGRYIRDARIPNVFMMMERSQVNGHWREGCPKDKEITQGFAFSITRVTSTGYLALAKKIFTYNKNPEKSADKELEKLRDQMNMFRRVRPKKTATVQADTPYKITAKTDSGCQDDLVIALCMCVYWREQYWIDGGQKYVEQHRLIRARTPMDFPP